MTINNYNECVKQMADRIYCFVKNQVIDSDRAKDIVQDSFIKLWEKREKIDKEKALSYLYKTAHNKIIDEYRKRKHFDFETMVEEQETEINYSDTMEIIDKALSFLPPLQQSIIMLKDNEGYSYEEISNILDISIEKVKVYLYRARVKIREIIRKKENII